MPIAYPNSDLSEPMLKRALRFEATKTHEGFDKDVVDEILHYAPVATETPHLRGNGCLKTLNNLPKRIFVASASSVDQLRIDRLCSRLRFTRPNSQQQTAIKPLADSETDAVVHSCF